MDRSFFPDREQRGSYYRRIEDIRRALDALEVESLPEHIQFFVYYFASEKAAFGIIGINERKPADEVYKNTNGKNRKKNGNLLNRLKSAALAMQLPIVERDLDWIFSNDNATGDRLNFSKLSARQLRNITVHDLGPTHIQKLKEHAGNHIPRMKVFLDCIPHVLNYIRESFHERRVPTATPR